MTLVIVDVVPLLLAEGAESSETSGTRAVREEEVLPGFRNPEKLFVNYS